MKRNVKVAFVGSIPSCFASVTWPITFTQGNSSSTPNVIKVETGSGGTHYLSLVGGSGGGHSSRDGDNDLLKIHAKLGASLGLGEGDVVTVQPHSGPFTEIKNAHVVCASADDWEILESNTDAVINGLLNQLRVVYLGQKFPFWVTKSLQINLKIELLDPPVTQFGILMDNSEIIVQSISSVVSHPLSMMTKKLFKLRIHPISIPDSVLSTFPTSSLVLKNTRNCFVFRESLTKLNKTCDDDSHESNQCCDPYFLADLLLPSNVNVKVKVFLLEYSEISAKLLKYFYVTNPPCVYVHPELIREFDMEVKSYIWIKDLKDETGGDDVPSGKLCQLGNTVDSFLQDKNRIVDKIFSSLLDESQLFVEASLSLGSESSHPFIGPNNGSLLIEGKMGSGKSWITTTLSKRVERSPYYVHCEFISCSKWRGKKPETMEKELRVILEACVRLQPALLVLDDLDVIAPVGLSQQENLQEQFLHFKICETIRESLLAYSGQHLTVVATTKSKEALNPYWKSRPGFHFFHKTIVIPPPNSVERLCIFEECLTRYKVSAHQISSLISDPRVQNLLKNTHDLYASPRFISTIAKRFASSLITRDGLNETDDFTTLDNFISDEIKFYDMEGNVGEKSVVHVKWENVGGLHKIKQDLVKILQWPIKYKKFFENAPIKLPSGILLYGYPGTGKTLLGLAIPSLVHTKFIHIKGPELLSKYIGASEQAVQDVFKRRGHDSTGVTDRVVNQFLAEMDGIEGGLGKGVYLVGATSRPDLIDPAVLRPGRLDKHLFFDLPNKEERIEILSHLGAQVNLQLSPETNSLDLLGEGMTGLTGADIHALVCNAQLAAVQRYLGKLGSYWNNEATSEEQCPSSAEQLVNKDLTPADIPVKVEDLADALSAFRPSLHGEEFTRFRIIYETFAMGGSGSGDTRQITAGKRATSA
ncbi:Peroxisome biogenesis factor 1 [Folsomia candida]|uniref:Peroxisomal ATPase PEX1 n=1 Tax=Folsomia candida TaxID=158441 RepID=A0A226EN54_FOLCA|nr:Peroxisome biogenesis factor 1 [Folsomia candida]